MKSRPARSVSPKRSMRCSITDGRPISIERPIPSSSMTWVARRTRSSSPSAKAMRWFYPCARSIMGFMTKPDRNTNGLSWSRQAANSAVGRRSTPASWSPRPAPARYAGPTAGRRDWGSDSLGAFKWLCQIVRRKGAGHSPPGLREMRYERLRRRICVSVSHSVEDRDMAFV